jgi:tRNA1(Val) A37 N6-methylase TrmN6
MWKAAASSCTKNKGYFALLIVAQCVFWFVETMDGISSPMGRLIFLYDRANDHEV